MKILYHHRIASKDGQFVHVEELISALKKLGHEIIVVGPIGLEQEDFGSDGGIITILKQYVPKFAYELAELSYAIYAYFKLIKAVLHHKPDVLYERYNLFLPAGVWLKKTFNLPMLLEVNAPIYEERSKYNGLMLKRLASWSESYVWNNADMVLPVTYVLADKVMNAKVKPEKLQVIPNGIDPDKFNQDLSTVSLKNKMGLNGKYILGFIGFMREWHGLDKVVDLLVDDKNRHLLLVGDGPARESIQKRAKILGVDAQVTITGVVERKNVATYISCFDIALQADIVDYASPLKLFEYMILGKAIVAPDKRNIREILVNNKNAILFKNDIKEDFISSINSLLADESKRNYIGKNAKNTIYEKKLTWKDNAKTVSRLFENLLEK